jgi:hypothetical protein
MKCITMTRVFCQLWWIESQSKIRKVFFLLFSSVIFSLVAIVLALLRVGLHNIAVKGEKNDYIEKDQH